MRKALLSVALLAAAGVSPAARAQVPVIDAGQLAQSVAMLQTAGQHLQQLQQLVQLAQQFRGVVGQAGAIAGPFQSGGFGSVFGSGGFGLQGLSSFGRFDPCQTGLCIGGRGAPTSMAYGTARGWSTDTFFRPTSGSFDDGRQQLAVRQAAGVGAAHDGLAVAISARQQIARSAERQAALEQAVAGARDLRGDVQGATAVASALYQQERERTAMLAALLQLSAARQIASDVRISVPEGARGVPAR
jgi:hypothetical protein